MEVWHLHDILLVGCVADRLYAHTCADALCLGRRRVLCLDGCASGCRQTGGCTAGHRLCALPWASCLASILPAG